MSQALRNILLLLFPGAPDGGDGVILCPKLKLRQVALLELIHVNGGDSTIVVMASVHAQWA